MKFISAGLSLGLRLDLGYVRSDQIFLSEESTAVGASLFFDQFFEHVSKSVTTSGAAAPTPLYPKQSSGANIQVGNCYQHRAAEVFRKLANSAGAIERRDVSFKLRPRPKWRSQRNNDISDVTRYQPLASSIQYRFYRPIRGS